MARGQTPGMSSKALGANEGDEAARNRARDGRSLRTADDDLEPLPLRASHRDDEPSAHHELVIERSRHVRPGSGGDEHFAGVWTGERAPGALERVRVETRGEYLLVPGSSPAAFFWSEPELGALAPRDGFPLLDEENDV